MILLLWTWLKSLPTQIQTTLISAFVAICIFILGEVGKLIHYKYSIGYKLRKEYNFEQRKNIKNLLSKNKTPLIKAAEDLNHRLWNLSRNVNSNWLNIPDSEWNNEERYYLRSFAYRLLLFWYWIIEAENSIYSFDLTNADKEDSLYLKYVKTLKHFFCDKSLLKDLNYNSEDDSNHFYKDNICNYTNYIQKNSSPIDFTSFNKKFKINHDEIKKVVQYLTNIKEDSSNFNYNIIKGFHLFLMIFLNKYGLDVHYTDEIKFNKLVTERYYNIKIKKSLFFFLEKNKILYEAKWIILHLKLTKEIKSPSCKYYYILVILVYRKIKFHLKKRIREYTKLPNQEDYL